MSRTRVLLITNHFLPDVIPQAKLMSQLAEGLRARGFSVDVLTTFPHYEGFRTVPQYRRRLLAREPIGDDVVTRVWAFASGRKQNMKHRLANYVSFNALATAVASLSTRRPDVVLANSGSFFTGVTGAALRLLRGAPFIYNVQDIYPDVPVRAGQLTNAAAIRNLERIESFMYRRAARITVISREQRTVLLGKGVPDVKLTVIPNFVDTDFIRPLPRDNEFSRAHGLADKFVIAYGGNLGYAYDFDTLLECAARLRDRPDIVFLLIGDGVLKADLEKKIATAGLDNVRMLPFQPAAQLPEVRAATDVQISLYRRGAAMASLPSKIYEIMASARPALIAAEPGTELWDLVEQNDCGICVHPENSNELLQAILHLADDRSIGHTLGFNGRSAVQKNFSRDVAADRYARLISELADIDKS